MSCTHRKYASADTPFLGPAVIEGQNIAAHGAFQRTSHDTTPKARGEHRSDSCG